MNISKTWLNLSLLAGVLMAAVSSAGIFSKRTYLLEHPSWAAQGYGQDVINIFLVFPLLIILYFLIKKGSTKAILLWLGVLMYIAYSYALYSFFMHFGPWFLLYIAILGISFYSLIGSIIGLSKQPNGILKFKGKGAAFYLLINGALFICLWLLEIIPAIFNGQALPSAASIGFWINPVHVLDLAFILPLMIIASISLFKKGSTGFLLAIPTITFAAIMGIAIISMTALMYIRGIADSFGPALIMAANVLIGLYLIYQSLKTDGTE